MKIQKIIQNKSFFKKNIVICGGSKGIGYETAKIIAKSGGNLCLIARNPEDLKKAAQNCEDLFIDSSQSITIIAEDTTQMELLRPKLEKYVQDYGIPDYLINAVGYAKPKYVLDYSLHRY